MKRFVFLLSMLFLLFCVTGCSVAKLDSDSFEKNIDTLLSEKNKIYNVNFDGYKYYVPEGLIFLNKEEYNALLQDRFGNNYYLYVDAISYYHKTDKVLKENKDSYYFKELEFNKKKGYIQILEANDKYYVELFYNYAKIEVYTSKKNLNQVINNMCYILRSIKFNDKVLESLIGDNVLSYKEENYTLFETESSQGDLLEVESEYGFQYDNTEDQDEIELNDD